MKVSISLHVVSVTQGNRTYRKVVVTFVGITFCGILLVKGWALIRGNEPAGQHFPCPEVFKVFGPDARGVEVSKQRCPSFSSVGSRRRRRWRLCILHNSLIYWHWDSFL